MAPFGESDLYIKAVLRSAQAKYAYPPGEIVTAAPIGWVERARFDAGKPAFDIGEARLLGRFDGNPSAKRRTRRATILPTASGVPMSG